MQTFAALADPTRRRILELLARRDRVVGDLVREFEISQPAVSRHLRVLREAGWVSSRGAGQHRVYSLRPGALGEIEDWVERRRRDWEKRFDAREEHLTTRPERKRGRKR